MKQRVLFIDFLRAFSIVGVIAIHTLSFSLENATHLLVWNFLQFVVVIFILCSGFVHGHYDTKLISFSKTIMWYKKRFVRIILPFYIYFAIHYILFFLFPGIFTHFGLQRNIPYIIGSLFFYGGINTNWLPLLFLELTLVTPFLFFLQKKRIVWTYIIFALVIMSVGTIWFFPYSLYKVLMWIPWSLIFLLGLFSARAKYTTKLFSALVLIGSIVFGILFFLWPGLHHVRNFTDNKYPPNAYYISYAVALTAASFLISKNIIYFIPSWIYEYISKKSYSLFFIHFIVLDFLEGIKVTRNVFILFFYVLSSSVIVSFLLDTIGKILKGVVSEQTV